MEFFCHCIPPKATHHSKKIVRVHRWHRLADSDALVSAKDTIDAVLLPHQPREVIAGAVELTLEFIWPWPAGTSKRMRAQGRALKTTKPDCSNVAKTLEDRLVALRFIEDDAKVVAIHVAKYIGEIPGIRVRISHVTAEADMDLKHFQSSYSSARAPLLDAWRITEEAS